MATPASCSSSPRGAATTDPSSAIRPTASELNASVPQLVLPPASPAAGCSMPQSTAIGAAHQANERGPHIVAPIGHQRPTLSPVSSPPAPPNTPAYHMPSDSLTLPAVTPLNTSPGMQSSCTHVSAPHDHLPTVTTSAAWPGSQLLQPSTVQPYSPGTRPLFISSPRAQPPCPHQLPSPRQPVARRHTHDLLMTMLTSVPGTFNMADDGSYFGSETTLTDFTTLLSPTDPAHSTTGEHFFSHFLQSTVLPAPQRDGISRIGSTGCSSTGYLEGTPIDQVSLGRPSCTLTTTAGATVTSVTRHPTVTGPHGRLPDADTFNGVPVLSSTIITQRRPSSNSALPSSSTQAIDSWLQQQAQYPCGTHPLLPHPSLNGLESSGLNTDRQGSVMVPLDTLNNAPPVSHNAMLPISSPQTYPSHHAGTAQPRPGSGGHEAMPGAMLQVQIQQQVTRRQSGSSQSLAAAEAASAPSRRPIRTSQRAAAKRRSALKPSDLYDDMGDDGQESDGYTPENDAEAEPDSDEDEDDTSGGGRGSPAGGSPVAAAGSKRSTQKKRGRAAAAGPAAGVQRAQKKKVAEMLSGEVMVAPNVEPGMQETQEQEKSVEVGPGQGVSRRSSQYRGVTRHRRSGRWEAHIWIKEIGRQVYLGGYEQEEHAAEAYDVAALKTKGQKVKINFELDRYTDLLDCMDSISLEELIMAVRRQSQGFSRGSSSYRGVTAHPSGRWESRIGVPGSKHVYLGLFEDEKSAACAYDRALVRLRGTTAATNFALSDYRRELAEFHQAQQAVLLRDSRIEQVMQGGPEFEKWVKLGSSAFPFMAAAMQAADPMLLDGPASSPKSPSKSPSNKLQRRQSQTAAAASTAAQSQATLARQGSGQTTVVRQGSDNLAGRPGSGNQRALSGSLLQRTLSPSSAVAVAAVAAAVAANNTVAQQPLTAPAPAQQAPNVKVEQVAAMLAAITGPVMGPGGTPAAPTQPSTGPAPAAEAGATGPQASAPHTQAGAPAMAAAPKPVGPTGPVAPTVQ